MRSANDAGVRTGAVTAVALTLACLWGCEPISDPWVTGNDYFEEERGRSPEQQKALRERALSQAGPSGDAGVEGHEFSRFIEK